MGQQQLLLIILGVIIVGIAIAVGLNLFQAGSIDANRDAMVSDCMNIAAHADQWRIRPTSMGGGGGDFTGYDVADYERLKDTGNADYVTGVTEGVLTITGTSKQGFGTVILTYDPSQDTDALRYVWSGTHEGGIGL